MWIQDFLGNTRPSGIALKRSPKSREHIWSLNERMGLHRSISHYCFSATLSTVVKVLAFDMWGCCRLTVSFQGVREWRCKCIIQVIILAGGAPCFLIKGSASKISRLPHICEMQGLKTQRHSQCFLMGCYQSYSNKVFKRWAIIFTISSLLRSRKSFSS